MSKKSQKSKSLNKNKINFISEQNKLFHRIRTTSRLPKEKEKEIVFNISSSLISLCKPKKSNSFSNDKKNLFYSKQRSYKSSKFKKNSRKDSKDERFNSAFSNDSQKLKKPIKPKKFNSFIINPKKIKTKKFNNRNSFKNNKFNFTYLNKCKTDSVFNSGKNITKKSNQIESKIKNNKKNSINISKWTNDLKNRENLTEGEYIHIQENLKQSLIGYEKTQLEHDLENFERTETTDLIKRLPTMKRSNDKINLKNVLTSDNENKSKDIIKYDKEKFRLLQHTGYVYDSLDDEEVLDAVDINNFYINPDSIYIFIFDSIIIILSFYCLFYFPYYLAHDSFIKSSNLNFKSFLFYMIDIFYIIDLIISFFRAYYNYDEILIQNYIDMSYHYIKSWFFLDILAAIPFYSIIFFIEEKNKSIELSNNFNSLSYLGVKLTKIHYLLILNKLSKIFKCFSENNRAFTKFFQILYKNDKIEEKSNIFFIIFILLSASNFGTCLLIFIGRNSYPSWMNEIKYDRNSFSSLYICSLYYLITTITTVGYGDIYGRTIPEISLQIILLIAGTCTYSYLISSVSNHIKKINEKSLIFENKLKILNDIKITNPNMEEKLYEKILRFLRYKKNTEKNKQKMIINSLPYSLRNLLIIEMYKPIINDFMIFKGLENSNCIVQLVTAFKPIYAIKNDILIQEGDFIEEVIFVKTGVISLEIGIDLNNPKESIIQYLNGNNEKDKSFSQSNFGLFNYTYETTSSTSTFIQNLKTNIKNEKINKNIHYLKVLDIRKNEHFGETLMFLNERSPLNAKVKSKKAELFFLQKEEVIKIFNTFPNIWNRINKKSVYNMKQIKLVVKKVLLKFSSMIGINLNNDLEKNDKTISLIKNLNKSSKRIKKSLIKKERKTKIKKVDKNRQNEEKKELNINKNKENNSNLSIIKSLNNLKEFQIYNNSKKEDFIYNLEKFDNKGNIDNSSFSKVLNIDKANNGFITSNSKDNLLNFESIPKSTQFSQSNSNINSHKTNNYQSNDTNKFTNKKISNNNCFSCFKELKNISNIESNIKKDINNNNDNDSTETIKMALNKKLYSLIDSESLKEEKENNEKENYHINDELYDNEIFDLNCKCKDYLLNQKNAINFILNDKIKLETLSRKLLENTWLKNLEKEKVEYLEKLLKQPKENSLLKELNNDFKNEKNFDSSSCDSWILNMSNN